MVTTNPDSNTVTASTPPPSQSKGIKMKIETLYTPEAEAQLEKSADHSPEAAEDTADIVIVMSKVGEGHLSVLETLEKDGRWLKLEIVTDTTIYHLYGHQRVVRSRLEKRQTELLLQFTTVSMEVVDLL